jgi:membrane-bound lytic murein transglycosylase MltF
LTTCQPALAQVPEGGASAVPGTAREKAEQRGIDPNKWFNNVELVIAEQIGTQTTTYVRNIYKYYVAYKLTLDAQAEADKARLQVVPNPQ